MCVCVHACTTTPGVTVVPLNREGMGGARQSRTEQERGRGGVEQNGGGMEERRR